MKSKLSLVVAMLILSNNLTLVNAQITNEAEKQTISETIAKSWDCRIKEIDNVFDDEGLYLGKNITVVYRTTPDEDFKPLKYDDPIAEGILLSNYELLEEKIRIINDETLEDNSGWYNLIQKCQKNLIPVDKYPESTKNSISDTLNSESKNITQDLAEKDNGSAWDCRIKDDVAVYDENGVYIGKNIIIEYRENPDESFKLLKYDDALAEGILMSNYELLEEKLIIINGETVEPNSGWYNLIQKCQKNLIPVDKYPEASDNEFNWLPTTEDEFTEFQKKNGPVALINGYIVMSVDPEDNHGLVFVESHEGTASYSVVKKHYACDPDKAEPGSSLNPIKVYKADSPGTLKFTWEKQEYRDDILESVWKSTNYYCISDDMSIKEISEDEYIKINSMEKGDINGDGITDLTDLSDLSLYLIGDKTFTDIQKNAADVDNDYEVKLTDLARLRQYISKVITTL